jgi:hypothetical protein
MVKTLSRAASPYIRDVSVNRSIALSSGRQAAVNPGCCDFSHGIRRDMKSVLQPWQLLLLILAGWINRHQQEVLELSYPRIRSGLKLLH